MPEQSYTDTITGLQKDIYKIYVKIGQVRDQALDEEKKPLNHLRTLLNSGYTVLGELFDSLSDQRGEAWIKTED